jgi:hypothetical protein
MGGEIWRRFGEVEHDLDHDHGHATESDADDVRGYTNRDSTTLRQLEIGN